MKGSGKILPNGFRNALEGRHEVKRATRNFGWLIIDKFVALIAGLFVATWVARYLTPSGYGELNFYISFVALFLPVSTLGLQDICIRNLVKRTADHSSILGSTAFLKGIGSLVHIGLAVVVISLLRPNTPNAVTFTILIGVLYIFRTGDVFDWWFRHRVQSKYVVFANLISTLLSSGTRITFVLLKIPLVAFVAMVPVQGALLTICLFLFFYLKSETPVSKWKVEKPVLVSLLKDASPIVVSSIAIVIYMKIDNVMIGYMLGNAPLGEYAAAVRLSEAYNGIGVAFLGSVFPAFLKAKEKNVNLYNLRLQNILDLAFWVTVFVSLFTCLAAEPLVALLFGPAFVHTATVLKIQIWSSIFVLLGSSASLYLISENLTGILAWKTAMGAAANIILNLILIPTHGIYGAAIATLISYGIASVFSLVIFRKTRKLFFMMCRTINIKRAIRQLQQRQIESD